ncbi:amidohydrolase [Streptomyces sp. NPDC057611]|uniref:amidohydrolase n=1 Tax=Streptomyces sp. NPDC057611 TaxID=3346182 RepID=UPI003691376E
MPMPGNDHRSRRSVLKRGGSAALAIAAGGAVLGHSPAASATVTSGPADLVLYNGSVLTLDGKFRVAEAVAIRHGVVCKVGTTSSVAHLVGQKTATVNLKGRTAMPGVNDSHLHGVTWGLTRPPFSLDVGYPTVRSIVDIITSVADAVSMARAGEWIRGRGWDPQYLAEGRYPTRQDLDAVSPNNPVYLTEWSGHAIWVNSAALNLAGITRDTVPPPGGVIVKDADGEPTGLLFEGARGLVSRVLPAYTQQERSSALELAVKLMHAEGITSYTEPGAGLDTIDMMANLMHAGRMRIRTNVMFSAETPDSLRETLAAYSAPAVDPRFLQANQVKIFADGVPTINKTAWLFEPYIGGGYGAMTLAGATPEEQVLRLEQLVKIAHEAGFQVGTHATGDRTINAVITAYEKAMRGPGWTTAPRHYVIHCDLVRPGDISRMVRSRIGGNFNPNIKWSLVDAQLDSIGEARANYEWPYNTAITAGVNVASASDAAVVYPNFRQGIETMVRREGRLSGRTYGPEQRITLPQAIATYTTASAWQDHAESWKGRLVDGYVGDVTVLDGDLLSIGTDEISDLPVAMTIVGGTVVYDEGSSDVKQLAAAGRGASWVKRQAPMDECGCNHH